MSAGRHLLRDVVVDARPRQVCSRARTVQGTRDPSGANGGTSGHMSSHMTGQPSRTPPSTVDAPAPDVDGRRQDALREGHALGLKQGLEAASAQVAQAVQVAQARGLAEIDDLRARIQAEHAEHLTRIDRAALALESAVAQTWARIEAEAAMLALEVVGRILGDPAQREAVVRAIVAQAVSQCAERPIRIRLSPQDHALVVAAESARQLGAAASGPDWAPDTSIAAGGCIVDTDAGSLDARLDLQLTRLLAAWRPQVRPAPSTPSEGIE